MIEGTPQSSVAYAIPPGGVSKIETDGSGSTQAGYATVVSDNENTQITGNIVYVVNGFEVSVPSSPLSPHYHVFAERDSTLNSGVAFANPGDKDISISLQLLDQDGQIANGTLIDLQAGGQLARFINQIFDDVGSDFQGSLHAQSDDEIFHGGFAPKDERVTGDT